MSSKKPTDTAKNRVRRHNLQHVLYPCCSHRMPSSSEDFTFARITSEANGLKTVIRKMTGSVSQRPCGVQNSRLRTFIPQEPIPVSYLPLADLCEVKHAYTQPDLVQDAVRILFVQLVRDRLFRGHVELRWVYRDGVLSRR